MKEKIIILAAFLLILSCKNQASYEDDILHRHEASEGLVGIELIDGRIGFEDLEGNLVIPFDFYKSGFAWDENIQYNYPVLFEDGIAPAKDSNKMTGFIDKTGNWVLEPIYSSANYFVNGLSEAYIGSEANRQKIYINLKGEVIYGPFNYKQYDFFYFYKNEEHAIFQSKETSLYGIAGADGEEKVPAIYQDIMNISEQRSFAIIDMNNWVMIDMEGNVLFEGRGRHFINGTSIVSKYENGENYYGVIDLDGNMILPYTDDFWVTIDYPFYNKYLTTYRNEIPYFEFLPLYRGIFPAIGSDTNNYGLYSVEGKWVVEPDYLGIQYVADGLYAYRTTDNEYGHMNEKGEEVDPNEVLQALEAEGE